MMIFLLKFKRKNNNKNNLTRYLINNRQYLRPPRQMRRQRPFYSIINTDYNMTILSMKITQIYFNIQKKKNAKLHKFKIKNVHMKAKI